MPFNYKPDVALQHYLLTGVEFTEAESFEVRGRCTSFRLGAFAG